MTNESVTKEPSQWLHQEHLKNLAPFCQAFGQALAGAGLGPEESVAAIRNGVAAECIQCGIRLSGEELWALMQPPAEKDPNPKVERLRLGDCARKGCDS